MEPGAALARLGFAARSAGGKENVCAVFEDAGFSEPGKIFCPFVDEDVADLFCTSNFFSKEVGCFSIFSWLLFIMLLLSRESFRGPSILGRCPVGVSAKKIEHVQYVLYLVCVKTEEFVFSSILPAQEKIHTYFETNF